MLERVDGDLVCECEGEEVGGEEGEDVGFGVAVGRNVQASDIHL